MKSIIILISISMLVLASCAYNNEETLYPNEICDTSNIKYSADIKPIFQQNCYGCHTTTSPGGYSGNVNLEDFTSIKRVVDNGHLLLSITHDPRGIPMPQGGAKLSDCNINKIEKWINQGIPNN